MAAALGKLGDIVLARTLGVPIDVAKSFPHPQIVNRQHIRAVQDEHQEHFGRPPANTFTATSVSITSSSLIFASFRTGIRLSAKCPARSFR